MTSDLYIFYTLKLSRNLFKVNKIINIFKQFQPKEKNIANLLIEIVKINIFSKLQFLFATCFIKIIV